MSEDERTKPGKASAEIPDPLGIKKVRDLYRNPLEGLIPKNLFASFDSVATMIAKSGLGRITVSEQIVGMYSRLGGVGEPMRAMHNFPAALQNSIAPLSELTEASRRLAEQFKGPAEMSRALGASILVEQASAYEKLFDRYRPAFDPSALAALNKQLADLVAPAATLLAAGFEKPSVLAKLDGIPGMIGTVSWMESEAEGEFIRAAALGAPKQGEGPRLDIEVEIRCALCGALMIAPQRAVEWQSETRAAIKLNILPMCPKCIHEVKGSPEFWIEKLEELTRPQLTIIQGGAENPESPGDGHLRLVEDSEAPEDPEDGDT